MLALLKEVWSRYPNALKELWFDGGAGGENLDTLIRELQPQAIGIASDLAPNYARLIGDESGFAPYPVWVSPGGGTESGRPDGSAFQPPEADTPIATLDEWFFKPATAQRNATRYRSSDELKFVYRNTVGHNSVLELGLLPDNTGFVPADQMAALQRLGDYVRECHSNSAALASGNGTGRAIRIDWPSPRVINRVIIQEDLAFGQLVLEYKIEAVFCAGVEGAPCAFGNACCNTYNREAFPFLVGTGTAIGHKRIHYFDSGPVPATGVIVTATQLYPGWTSAHWRNLAAFEPCAGDAPE
jgi:hypothetical protein